eukprot:XP_024465271.1 uncharacterized protein LOC112328788 [Populus trichocarpa]
MPLAEANLVIHLPAFLSWMPLAEANLVIHLPAFLSRMPLAEANLVIRFPAFLSRMLLVEANLVPKTPTSNPRYGGSVAATSSSREGATPITVDLTADGPPGNRSTDFMNYDKLSALEERLRAIEGNDWFYPMRAAEVCLVPNIIVPKNFRIPEFIKYIGLECPNIHLRSYCNKMAEYKFNLEIAPDRTILMGMEKENQESVRAYVQRWRDKATYVQPPLIDTEMVMLFANTFQSPYYEHLIGSSAQHFHEVVRIAKRIEQAMKRGKIEGSAMNSRIIMRDDSEGG